ncbi:hypothetical protein CPB84DRAFT_1844796 [Gymnopilus junonius]|uniref:J domain-containing protein n=1 Tax=Gymnopilus junonius TaxID=109634 RepID=A0A9P5NT56_GYMJU|nr:hypothetical protein CPB84DRAFT_1844796 [Gymnopilus junonius]
MATYEYDEAGVMAAYFLITFLALVLVPLTISSLTRGSGKKITDGCQCTPCVERRKLVSKQGGGSIFSLKFSRRTYFLLGGWSLFAFVCYRVSLLKVENKIYNPFEILGISTNTEDKDIKSHFKKLSKLYHPDKVKATANLTIEAIQDRFVQIQRPTNRYLTDERIKENWIKYNHPDGPQSTTMGIALPKWIVEGQNRIWVLVAYGVIFGGALPALVGRWWFGSRQKTKDGINAQSAAAFFKSIKEESTIEECVAALGKAYKWELPPTQTKSNAEVDELEKEIQQQVGAKWTENKLKSSCKPPSTERPPQRLGRTTWLLPTLAIMRLYSYIAQALPINASDRLKLTQLPGLSKEDILKVAPKAKDMEDLLHELEEKKDERLVDVKRAMEKWGRVDIVDATFKVIGEKTVTPSAIIYLLVKLRISPPGSSSSESEKEPTVDEKKKAVQTEEQRDDKFLSSRSDSEDLPASKANSYAAHAPFWPGTRKPSWWIVLADDKSNRVVVPPIKITDIPYAQPGVDGDYRAYKIQFQGPPNTGLFTWKVYVVSDTFAGEEAVKDISLKIEDAPATDEQPTEDEISDPDEDTIAGQMAAMRGGKVKKHVEEESDDESSTDDDKSSDSDSDSD